MKSDFDLFVLAFHDGTAFIYVDEDFAEGDVEPVTPAGTPVTRVRADQMIAWLRAVLPAITAVQIVGADSRRPRPIAEFETWLTEELNKG